MGGTNFETMADERLCAESKDAPLKINLKVRSMLLSQKDRFETCFSPVRLLAVAVEGGVLVLMLWGG